MYQALFDSVLNPIDLLLLLVYGRTSYYRLRNPSIVDQLHTHITTQRKELAE